MPRSTLTEIELNELVPTGLFSFRMSMMFSDFAKGSFLPGVSPFRYSLALSEVTSRKIRKISIQFPCFIKDDTTGLDEVLLAKLRWSTLDEVPAEMQFANLQSVCFTVGLKGRTCARYIEQDVRCALEERLPRLCARKVMSVVTRLYKTSSNDFEEFSGHA